MVTVGDMVAVVQDSRLGVDSWAMGSTGPCPRWGVGWVVCRMLLLVDGRVWPRLLLLLIEV